jgi:tetratricopeptide (TPR) repeat protein
MAEGEIEQFVNRYLSQAQTFANKNYYLAALDLLELVLDMDPDNEVATGLKADIRHKIDTEIERNLEKARLARQEGRALDAVEAYNRILELSPDADSVAAERRKLLSGLDVAQQLNLGIEHFKQQRYQQARQRLEAVLRLDPGNAVAQEYLQRIDSAEKQPSTLEDLQKNREIWNLYLEGIRHMRNQQYQQAIDAWQKVLNVFPDNEETRNNIEQARLRLQSEQSN